jgi:hypothetical protein
MELSDATEKTPATPRIDLGTFRLVAQCLNHYASPGPYRQKKKSKNSEIIKGHDYEIRKGNNLRIYSESVFELCAVSFSYTP